MGTMGSRAAMQDVPLQTVSVVSGGVPTGPPNAVAVEEEYPRDSAKGEGEKGEEGEGPLVAQRAVHGGWQCGAGEEAIMSTGLRSSAAHPLTSEQDGTPRHNVPHKGE